VPSFEWGKYLAITIAIGVIAGGLMYGYDSIANLFNTLVSSGKVSHIGVQSMTIIYWGIVCYAPINLLFWSLHCLMVANARTEYNSGFITSNPTGHFILFAIIIAAGLLNFGVCTILDPLSIQLSDTASSALSGMNLIGSFGVVFSAAHVICALAVGIAYLYMIFLSVSIETLQWGQPTI
jgi:hypothetical protein